MDFIPIRCSDREQRGESARYRPNQKPGWIQPGFGFFADTELTAAAVVDLAAVVADSAVVAAGSGWEEYWSPAKPWG